MSETQREELESLVYLLNQHQLTEVEVEKNGVRIRIRRDPAPLSLPAADQPSETREGNAPEPSMPAHLADQGKFVTVTSPIVGTFYRSPSPDADPYVEEGDFVKKGQVLCIVEAMKLMNEIEAESDGRIMKVLVESTMPVEYGQALFLIDPVAVS
ncbi:MAG: acetyl-CoA carboxylase biotin carboxyl carrier protein [Nitrospirales bacterium]|nr:acetyl-CoA carboxylase biotin carboxyl carrier protein [Nitrospira sp.]MDR4503012.1 acetyl-CoA carboxylase biotin carboxyl carrier protein [Nitrospirales bacterium]